MRAIMHGLVRQGEQGHAGVDRRARRRRRPDRPSLVAGAAAIVLIAYNEALSL